MLKIHFLNVGHGDCTLIELPAQGNMGERLMMIDIDYCKSLSDDEATPASSGVTLEALKAAMLSTQSFEDYYRSLLVDPYDYYSDNLKTKYPSIFRYIQTHPDMDHMSGLHRFFWQEAVPLWNFWDIAHTKEKDEDDFSSGQYSYLDWLVYQLLGQGKGPNETTHKALQKHRSHTGDYWTGDNIEILSPTPELLEQCNDDGTSWNNASYVLKISYGGRSVILGGERAEGPAWESMLADAKHLLTCDILKAAHHGRESGHHAGVLDVMDPDYVICSVGKNERP